MIVTNNITQHNIFGPSHSKAETKADITNCTARAIVGAEAERRDVKTARLREARLAREAAMTPAPAAARRAKPAVKRRGRSSM